jgi:hypothetical protein
MGKHTMHEPNEHVIDDTTEAPPICRLVVCLASRENFRRHVPVGAAARVVHEPISIIVGKFSTDIKCSAKLQRTIQMLARIF